MYIHVLINVPRLLIEKDVVDINNETLTSITINRLMVYVDKQINVTCYLAKLKVLDMISMYIHTLNYKIRRIWWKSDGFVRNQVIKYRFGMVDKSNWPITDSMLTIRTVL